VGENTSVFTGHLARLQCPIVSDNVVGTSNWSNFGRLLRRVGLLAIAGLSCWDNWHHRTNWEYFYKKGWIETGLKEMNNIQFLFNWLPFWQYKNWGQVIIILRGCWNYKCLPWWRANIIQALTTAHMGFDKYDVQRRTNYSNKVTIVLTPRNKNYMAVVNYYYSEEDDFILSYSCVNVAQILLYNYWLCYGWKRQCKV